MYTKSKIGPAEFDGAVWDFVKSLEGANLAQKLLLAVLLLLYSFIFVLFLALPQFSPVFSILLNPSP
jgi:hypothetical protein